MHVYGYSTIWAWVDSQNYTGGTWPGATMAKENENWYTYTLQNLETCNVIFSNNGSSQTGDLSVAKGEHWFKNNQWYDSNPDDQVAPVLASFVADKNGTV